MSKKNIIIAVASIFLLVVVFFFWYDAKSGWKNLASVATNAGNRFGYSFDFVYENIIGQANRGTEWTPYLPPFVPTNPNPNYDYPRSPDYTQLWYNYELDGYGGLAKLKGTLNTRGHEGGYCLHRSQFISDPDEQRICANGENAVLMKTTNGFQPGYNNILIKNATIKNAFNAEMAAGGTGNPTTWDNYNHIDTFYSGASAKPNDTVHDGWLVLQDTIIKNSDHGLMQVGETTYTGVVYQNVSVYCDSWWRSDLMARARNDQAHYPGSQLPNGWEGSGCDRKFGAGTGNGPGGPVWLINILPDNVDDGMGTPTIENPSEDRIYPQPTKTKPVIIIGNTKITPKTRVFVGGRPQYEIDHRNVYRFDYIEDALASTELKNILLADQTTPYPTPGSIKPPYIELSCSGWRNPPAGCTPAANRGFQGLVPVNGACGVSGTVTTRPTNLCSSGNPSISTIVPGSNSWTCSGTGSPTRGSDASCSVTWNPTSLTLSVAKSGLGSVASINPAGGISCGSDCSEAYTPNISVTLKATPNAGQTFTRWTGCTSVGGVGGTECTVTMDNDKTATAQFSGSSGGGGSNEDPTMPSPTITSPIPAVLPSSTGSVTVTWDGMNGKYLSRYAEVNSDESLSNQVTNQPSTNESLTFDVFPGKRYKFWVHNGDYSRWSPQTDYYFRVLGSGETVPTTATLTMNQTTGGTIVSAPTNTTFPIVDNTSVTFTATANPGYTFTRWTDDCSGDTDSNTQCTLTMNSNKTVSAVFSLNSAGVEDEVLSVSGPTSIQRGGTATVTVTYNTEQNRDIIVQLKRWDAIVYSTIRTSSVVIWSSKVISVQVPVPMTVAIGTELNYLVFMTPSGQEWSAQTSSKGQSGVTATDPGNEVRVCREWE